MKIVLSEKQVEKFLSYFIEEALCIVKERKCQIEKVHVPPNKIIQTEQSFQDSVAI